MENKITWKVLNEGKRNAKVKGVIRPRSAWQMIKTLDYFCQLDIIPQQI